MNHPIATLRESRQRRLKGGQHNGNGTPPINGNRINLEKNPEPILLDSPPNNLTKDFNERIRQIFAADVRVERQLFEPLCEAPPDRAPEDILYDPIARELFSFMQELLEKIHHLPMPRRPEDMEHHSNTVRFLMSQRSTVHSLFWQQVHQVHHFDISATLGIFREWQLMRLSKYEFEVLCEEPYFICYII